MGCEMIEGRKGVRGCGDVVPGSMRVANQGELDNRLTLHAPPHIETVDLRTGVFPNLEDGIKRDEDSTPDLDAMP